jgi:transcriptional regulator with XRE-family HTH domain
MRIRVLLPELMEAQGINQKELAELTGLNPRTVGQLYRNKSSRVDFETLARIAAHFNLDSVNQLLRLESAGQ